MRSCSDPEIDSKFVSFEIVNSQNIMKANANVYRQLSKYSNVIKLSVIFRGALLDAAG